MIRPEDEIIVDLSGSCTKEEAVAKLLGWMKGPIRSKIIRMTEHGISEDQLPLLPSMEDPLNVQLQEIREAARQAFIAAAETNATNEELEEKESAVTHVDSLIRKASMYMIGIDEELSKGEDSDIKIDPKTSEETGVTHITLRSLDRWARKAHQISILDDQEQPLSPENTHVQPVTHDMEEDLDTQDGLKRRDAESLLTTFAFLVEALVKEAIKNGSKRFGEDKPNVMAIARHIEELAYIANNKIVLPGQGNQSIKKRINRAMEVKKLKLPER